jgi:hypothetical protein
MEASDQGSVRMVIRRNYLETAFGELPINGNYLRLLTSSQGRRG